MAVVKKGKKFYVVIEMGKDPETKRRTQKWLSGYDTEKEAADAEKAIYVDRSRGLWVEPNKITVHEFLNDVWLPTKKIKPATKSVYKLFIDRIKSHPIGSILLQKLGPLHMEEYQKYLFSLGLSSTSVRHELSMFKGALKWGVDKDLIVKNPARTITLPARRKFKPNFVDAAGMKKIIDAASKNAPQMDILVRLGGDCGLRVAEAAGVRWSSIDFENANLHVDFAYDYVEGPDKAEESEEKPEETSVNTAGKKKQKIKRKLDFIDLKTINSDREIPLTPDTLNALTRLRAYQESLLKEKGWENPNDLVNIQFVNGRPCSPDYIDRRFRNFLKANQLPPMRFHDLRHSYASILRDSGVPMETISELLGHYDLAFTHKVYAHPSDDLHRAAATALQEKMDSLKEEKKPKITGRKIHRISDAVDKEKTSNQLLTNYQ